MGFKSEKVGHYYGHYYVCSELMSTPPPLFLSICTQVWASLCMR